MITPEKLDEMERRAEAASKGPWAVGTRWKEKDDEHFGAHYVLSEHSPYSTSYPDWGRLRSLHGCAAPLYKSDADFIANARTDLPALIRAHRAALRVVEAAKVAKAEAMHATDCESWIDAPCTCYLSRVDAALAAWEAL